MRRRQLITSAAALTAYAGLSKLARAYDATSSASKPLPTGFYNFTGSNLSNWQRASAAQQRGEANAVIGCLGDSTVAGQGASSNELGSNAKSMSWPTQLARLIPNGSWSSVWGDNNVAAAAGDVTAFDARLRRSGWAVSNTRVAATLCGGSFYGHPSALAHAFTPTNPIDTIEVWYARSPGNGRFSIDVDGGLPLAMVDCDGPNAFMKATTRCAPDQHTVNLQKTTDANDVYLTGLRCFNSAVKEVSVYNLGGCRWGSADFVVDEYPWSTLPAVTAIAPNLVIFQAGIINDWDANAPLATVRSNMATVIHALKSVNCDVILMSGAPSEAGVYASYATQATYVANMRSLAYAADVPLIDIWELFGGTWKSSTMNDSLHPNQAGYALIAGYASTAILDPSARSLS